MRGRLLLLMLSLVAGGGAAQTPVPPMPGTLVDVGGRRLHVQCLGTGAPVVILENGGGGFAVEWTLVQAQVARQTRVCAYNRAGYAWSEPAPVLDGMEGIVDDLHAWMRAAGVSPPLVIAGASLGALYARAYQRRFPEAVAGLVFVDGSHEDAITLIRAGKPVPIGGLSRNELAAAYDEYRRVAPPAQAGPPDAPPLDRLPAALREARHWAARKLIAEVGRLPAGPIAAESWRQELASLRAGRLAKPHPLRDLPLVVLERSEGSTDAWHSQQVELSRLSSAGRLVRVDASGHLMHLDQPAPVAAAILDVVAAVRRRH